MIMDWRSYEDGYEDGTSGRQADWSACLDEFCKLPDDINPEDPRAVATYIARLQRHDTEAPPPPRYDPLPDPVVPELGPHIYLGMFENKWASIAFAVGIGLLVIGTILRVLAAWMA